MKTIIIFAFIAWLSFCSYALPGGYDSSYSSYRRNPYYGSSSSYSSSYYRRYPSSGRGYGTYRRKYDTGYGTYGRKYGTGYGTYGRKYGTGYGSRYGSGYVSRYATGCSIGRCRSFCLVGERKSYSSCSSGFSCCVKSTYRVSSYSGTGYGSYGSYGSKRSYESKGSYGSYGSHRSYGGGYSG